MMVTSIIKELISMRLIFEYHAFHITSSTDLVVWGIKYILFLLWYGGNKFELFIKAKKGNDTTVEKQNKTKRMNRT